MTLDAGDEPGKLFVGGLSWETSHDKLIEYFHRYGEVTDCVVMKNPETGRSRGFGFVTFKDPSCVQIILASGPHILDGRTVDPKECNPKSAQKGKREAKIGNFPKVFLGGLPPNVNESTLRDFFSKFGKVMEVVIMYDQEKKKTRGFGFLSFDCEDSIDKVVAEHFVNISGKQVEVKRAEPRDKQGKQGHMNNNNMQHQMSGGSGGHGHGGAGGPPWNQMWGPQSGPPMSGPPPGQPPMPLSQSGPVPMHNGMMPSSYPGGPQWTPQQQTPYGGSNTGWNQPNYQGYQGWAGYGYPPPQGWGNGYAAYGNGAYGAYPGYGQTSTTPAVNAQTPGQSMAGNASSVPASNVSYVAPAVVPGMTPQAQGVAPSQVPANPQVAATQIGTYPQDASGYGPSRVNAYANSNLNYAYPMQAQTDVTNVAAASYAPVTSNQTSYSNNRTSSQTQYHPYRRV